MAVPQAKALIEQAEKGEKLTTKQRRHCVAWIMATDYSRGSERDSMTNAEMAELFQVSERTIHIDKVKIREEVAKNIKAEDVAMVIADIRLSFEKVIKNIEKSGNKASLGTRTYLDHQLAAFKLQMDYVRGLQDLGIYPKELGNIHVEKYEFSATVGLATSENQRPVNMFDQRDVATIEAEILGPKALTDGKDSNEQQPSPAVGAPEAHVGEASNAEPSASAQLPAV